jgi:hypothetical protein
MLMLKQMQCKYGAKHLRCYRWYAENPPHKSLILSFPYLLRSFIN